MDVLGYNIYIYFYLYHTLYLIRFKCTDYDLGIFSGFLKSFFPLFSGACRWEGKTNPAAFLRSQEAHRSVVDVWAQTCSDAQLVFITTQAQALQVGKGSKSFWLRVRQKSSIHKH